MLMLSGIGVFAIFALMVFSTSLSNQIFSLDNSNMAQATSGKTHTILLSANILPNGQLAYKMEQHTVDDDGEISDITSRYSNEPSIPGPTIVLDEGDHVSISLRNDIAGAELVPHNLVSLHVHGVHYTIHNDGTLEHLNMIADQGAAPGETRTFHWTAGPGTAGTWPYHDHTFGGINGAEHRGLFGAVIVNPTSGQVSTIEVNSVNPVNVSDIKKDFVLYLGDDAFWGMEIDQNGNQTPLWVNPTLRAKTDDYVRFHLIALGTDIHKFQMGGYQWLSPGTTIKINSVDIGPLENHQFTVKTKNGNMQYFDQNESNKLMGMKGTFVGSTSGGASTPGPSPLEGI
jgi:manganese oxidase